MSDHSTPADKKRIAFVVNGAYPSAMGIRARSFATRLSGAFEIGIFYRNGGKIAAMFRLFWELLCFGPKLIYVFDIGVSGSLAAMAYRSVALARLVFDTGDPIYELAKSSGRGALGLMLTYWLEESALQNADFIVVRGTRHKESLNTHGIYNVETIQDGVDTSQFVPCAANTLRREWSTDGALIVGLIGSSHWNERWKFCYGWDLVEALGILKNRSIMGVLIGGGDGIDRLRKRSAELGVQDKILLLGHVPYERLPEYLSAMDVCLSTQSNDRVGQFRTTGKLPLYLACGKYVLASRVGEAELVLGDSMLLEYSGIKDDGYPPRLASRLDAILKNREQLAHGLDGVTIAREKFDYGVLAKRLQTILERLL